MRTVHAEKYFLPACAAGALLVVAFTLYCQFGLYSGVRISGPSLPNQSDAAFPRSDALSAALERRKHALTAAADVSAVAEMRGDGVVFAVRPAIKLRGVAVSRGRRCALFLVEGEKNAQIVLEGDSVAGIVIKEITPAGARCVWRGEDFLVPVE